MQATPVSDTVTALLQGTDEHSSDEHNYDVLIHGARELTARNACATVFEGSIYAAYHEVDNRSTAETLAQLEKLGPLTLILRRYDRTGTLVQEEIFAVSLKPGNWRRVLHTDTFWLYGVLFDIDAGPQPVRQVK